MDAVIGSVGLTLLLAAFVLNQLKRLEPETISYNVLNIAGSLLLMYYALVLDSVPFVVLEAVWALFATYQLIQLLRQRKT